MKTLTIGLLAASLLFLIVGCADDEDDNSPLPTGETHIQITANPDTLWFVTGDTVTAEVTVLVTRDYCSQGCCVPLPGAVVHAALLVPHHGWLTLANPQQGDTTDAYGEVRYHYYTAVTGTDDIRASCEGAVATGHIVAAHPYHGEALDVILFLVPQTINLSQPGGDTMRVQASALVRDEWNLPVPGLHVEFTSQRGWLEEPTPTDGNGEAEAWWHQPATYPDTAWTELTVEIIARIGNFQDSQLILIRQ